MAKDLLATNPFIEALEFARGLRAPDRPLDFPSYSDYVRLVSARVDYDPELLDEDIQDFQEVPQAYELAYLTARLERLRAHILVETGVDVSAL
jgi:hypothetical protein